jgi:hypothetical protein
MTNQRKLDLSNWHLAMASASQHLRLGTVADAARYTNDAARYRRAFIAHH